MVNGELVNGYGLPVTAKCATHARFGQNHLTDRRAGARLQPMSDDVAGAPYPGVFAELLEGSILRLEPGERLWKLYFLRPASGRDERVEHRIFTKLQADGRIGLVSYNFKMTPGNRPVKAGWATARDIPETTLNQLIWNVVRQSQIGPEELEVVDLSGFDSFAAQIAHLRDVWSVRNEA